MRWRTIGCRSCLIVGACALTLVPAAFAANLVLQEPTTPQTEAQYQEHLLKAKNEASLGSVAEAMADIQRALALNPQGAEGWYELGSLLGQAGDFPGAEKALRKAIELQPDLAKAHYSLALALVGNPEEKQDWTGAIAECRESLKAKPDYAEALNLLGAGLTNTGRPEAAVEVLRQATRLAPALAEAHFNLALAEEGEVEGSPSAQITTGPATPVPADKRLQEAIDQYRAAIAVRGDYPEASGALGKLLFQSGQTTAAESEERTALRHNPDLMSAHYTLARILRSTGRAGEADIEFAAARDLTERPSNGSQSSQLSNQALQLAAKGDLTGAIAALRKAIELKPDYGVPQYNLGLLLADTGDMQGAALQLTKAISLMPGQAKLWFDLGRVEELRKAYPAALADLAWAGRLAPADPAIQSEIKSLAASHPSPGGPDLPQQPVAGSTSDTAPAHIQFAAQLVADGDTAGAVGELLRALALDPANQEARRSLARVYGALGREPLAMLEYHKEVESFPDDAEASLALGKMLLESGKPAEALTYLRSALRVEPQSVEIRDAIRQAETAAVKADSAAGNSR